MAINLHENMFGIDISDRALRLVQFKKRGRKTILSSYNEVGIPQEVLNNSDIKEKDKLVKALKQLVKTAKGDRLLTKNIIAVLPEQKTFIKVIEVTLDDKKPLPELIKEEVKNHIPIDIENIYLDWQQLNEDKEEKEEKAKFLIGAAPKDVIRSYTSVLEEAGLVPNILEIEAASIIRSLIAEEDDKKAKIIIDFGAIRTGLIIYDQQTVQFTVSLPISGIKITETISKSLKLDWKKSEKAKIVCGLDKKKCEGALLKILLEPIDRLTTQIKKSMAFYKSNFSNSKEISEIILCGGGANFLKIDEVLSEKLNLPVKVGNPFTNATQTKRISIPKNKILSYTTAIGLALRAFQK